MTDIQWEEGGGGREGDRERDSALSDETQARWGGGGGGGGGSGGIPGCPLCIHPIMEECSNSKLS